MLTFAAIVMKITFWGAARQVTGSMYLLETRLGYRVLVDCGLDYEQQRFFHDSPPGEFPFDPASIDVLLLTHAHIDHSGNIPNLVKQGFNGKVFCTPPTADLIRHLLLDSANIQAGDYRKAKGKKKGKRPQKVPQPLYAHHHVMEAMEQVITLPYHKAFRLNDELEFTFYQAGHLLGAASIYLRFTENGQTRCIGFTGDLGRKNSKLVTDPETMPELDYLVSESTYGARTHQVKHDAETEMLHHIQKTCVDINGKLIIPAFSVGRTQAIVHTLNQLDKAGKLPRIKVFVDSPLALRTTPYYEHYRDELNSEAKTFMDEHGDLFDFENLRFVQGIEDENDLHYTYEPCVIISAAGMVEGGRIQEHVKNHIQNPFATILIAGFCAEGTLGHRLLSGQPNIRIKNKELRVYAKINSTDVFSSHADQEQLLQNINAYRHPGLKKIFLTHGEQGAMETLQQAIEKQGFTAVELPEKGDTFFL